MKPKTADQIKAELAQKGKSGVDLAREIGCTPNELYRVLNGFHKCRRGIGHRIAVQIGMKEGSAT